MSNGSTYQKILSSMLVFAMRNEWASEVGTTVSSINTLVSGNDYFVLAVSAGEGSVSAKSYIYDYWNGKVVEEICEEIVSSVEEFEKVLEVAGSYA